MDNDEKIKEGFLDDQLDGIQSYDSNLTYDIKLKANENIKRLLKIQS